MKRFLSLFAILAMIVSMFSGVAFAATATPVKVDLTREVEYYRGATQRFTINGSTRDGNDVLNSEYSGKSLKLDLLGVSPSAIGITNKTVKSDGTFAFSALGLEIGNYVVSGEDFSVTPASFVVVPRLELENPANLNFNYPVKDEVYITGVFVDGNGPKSTSNDELWIGYVDGNLIAKANYVNENSFGFLFDGGVFDETEKLALYYVVDGSVAAGDTVDQYKVVKTDITGEVKASNLSFTASPTRLTRGINLGPQEVTIKTTLANSFFKTVLNNEKYDLKDNYSFVVNFKDGSTVLESTTYTNSSLIGSYHRASQELDFSVDVDSLDAGTYTLEVVLKDGSLTAYKGTVDIRVDRPQRYTLVKWDDSDLTTNAVDFGLSSVSGVNPIEVVKAISSTTSAAVDTLTDGYYKVTYSGAGLSEASKYLGDHEDAEQTNKFTVTPKETGVLKLVIEAYEGSTRVASFTRELEVKGMNVSLSDSEIVVDETQNITVTVTDADGTPLNNAEVTLVGAGVDKKVSSENANIIDGNYIFKDVKATSVANIDVTVKHLPDDYVDVAKVVKVVGKDVYTVDAETTTLLNGVSEHVYVSVHNEDGDVVYTNFEVLEYNSKGNLISTSPVFSISSTRYDRNSDGVRESSRLTITPNKDAVELVIRATSTNKKEKGDVTIEVLKPELVHTGSATITENFKTAIEFTVVDPRDGSVMEDLTLELESGIEFEDTTSDLADMLEENLAADIEDVWTAEFKITDVEWDIDEDDTNEVIVNLMDGSTVVAKLGTLEVKKATVEANPETIIIGAPTRLELTYLDADGNPIEGKSVKLDGTEIGKTDADGKVEYSASSSSSVSLTFVFATDVSGETVSKSVRSSADIEPPVATIEVDGNSAVIRITDNVRVSKALVNGEEVDMFFPMAEVTHIVSLRPGVNTFTVQAVDINNNYSVTTLTAEPAVDEVVSFTIGEASEYGVPVLMGETTMVPVRFAEILGAVIDWDNDTKTATYSANGTVVEVTVGSTTAVVNGENVQMPVAPYINEVNRTMVPLRMIAQELGFTVTWTSHDAPITITK